MKFDRRGKGNLHVVSVLEREKAKIIHFKIGHNTDTTPTAKIIRHFNPINIETTSTDTGRWKKGSNLAFFEPKN